MGDVVNLSELPELATRVNAAAYLGVSIRTVDRLREEGKLESVHVRGSIRIPRDSLRTYAESQRVAGNDDADGEAAADG